MGLKCLSGRFTIRWIYSKAGQRETERIDNDTKEKEQREKESAGKRARAAWMQTSGLSAGEILFDAPPLPELDRKAEKNISRYIEWLFLFFQGLRLHLRSDKKEEYYGGINCFYDIVSGREEALTDLKARWLRISSQHTLRCRIMV